MTLVALFAMSAGAWADDKTVWQEWLTSDGQPVVVETTSADIPTWMGNAETPWADPAVRFNNNEDNYLICCWAMEKGNNLNDDSGWDPFPAGIDTDPDNGGNHVFVCHGQAATIEGDASAYDNQLLIRAPKEWKVGDIFKIFFRYKCNYEGAGGVPVNLYFHGAPFEASRLVALQEGITFTSEWGSMRRHSSSPRTWPAAAQQG